MTKRQEFVRDRFGRNIYDAMNSVVEGKGQYKQYIDSWDHLIKIDFQIIDGYILGDIYGELETDNKFTETKYNYRGWVKIETTIEDALIALVAYAQRVTRYNPVGIDSDDE